ncbi:hypothetical protein [Brucella pseudogrignonensis]|uniref:hypothetical protein n=1 Tax=Brucella pseudogrignonensis TaxID=419475 RepID=UPI0038CF7838
MIRLTMTLVLLTGLFGCQSVKYPLPTCDGYSKRPLNKSMWNWEQTMGAGQVHSAPQAAQAEVRHD